uniref:FAD dependent oxidoreductase domain-containing protein n=1 Tax=uncultured SAR11 cluster alpha proteobacterium H17925_45G17 TaxID=715038 RepID=E7CA24_9PROT|nr:hypothetical protein [uncultured SAR11 cluster alpha proteobacterium H17925_45G17]
MDPPAPKEVQSQKKLILLHLRHARSSGASAARSRLHPASHPSSSPFTPHITATYPQLSWKPLTGLGRRGDQTFDRVTFFPAQEYDVVVIGAGCIGGNVARALAKYQLSVLVLEVGLAALSCLSLV